jgi:hypothetical protein
MTMLSPDWTLIIWSLFAILLLVVFLRAVYSLWGRDDLYQSTKLLWSIFIVLAPVIGFICYVMFGSRSDISFDEENN